MDYRKNEQDFFCPCHDSQFSLDGELTKKKLETFNWLTRNRSHKDENGNPIKLYSDETLAAAKDAVKGKTEMDALVAYLQSLGHALK